MSKAEYEPIPDVAPTTTNNREDYEDMNPEQIELFTTLDTTIKDNSSFAFQLPSMPSSDSVESMLEQGKNMLTSMITPTITAVIATITAVMIGFVHQFTTNTEGISATLSNLSIVAFPYINAITMFLTSFFPIQQRCTTSVEPVITQIKTTLPNTIDKSVQDISTQINSNIDTIETTVRQVLEPALPTLQRATQYETMIRTVKSDVNIPDATDIDTEINNARSTLTTPMETVTTQIQNQFTKSNNTLVPYPLRSVSNFYYSVIVPIGIIALITQLGLVYYTTSTTNTKTTTTTTANSSITIADPIAMTTTTSSLFYLRGSILSPTTTIQISKESTGSNSNMPDSLQFSNYNDNNITSQLVGSKEMVSDKIQDVQTQATDQIHNSTEMISNKVHDVETQITTEITAIQETVTQEMSNITGQIQEEYKTFQNVTTAEISKVIDPNTMKPLLYHVVLSYLLAFLQMCMVYLLTSPQVKTFIMNLIMRKVSKEIDTTIRATGIPTIIEDIFVVKMGTVRTKLLKILSFVNEIQPIMDQLGIGDNSSSSSKNPVAALSGMASKFGFGK